MKKQTLLSFFTGLGLFFTLTACNHHNDPTPTFPKLPTIAESDSLVMVDFYHAMKGEEWEKKWDLKNPNTWYNVEFGTNENGLKVVKYILIDNLNTVEGSVLPQSLNRLQHLEELDIFMPNGLNCSIPETLYECPSLRFIYISNASLLKGPLSSHIGKLAPTLEHLAIVSCKNFISELPPEIGLCKKITYLNLMSCYFYGKIPYEICHLYTIPLLGKNHFEEIDWQIFTDPESKVFPTMEENDFTGVIPQEVLDSKNWKENFTRFYPFNPGFGFSNYEKPNF